jgi:uncharacterized membrane protein YGL010W
MRTRTIHDWFSEYGESHQHPVNKLIHWICVPSIFFSIVCLLSLVPVAGVTNLATVAMVFASLFYVRLSLSLGAGMMLFYAVCWWLTLQLQELATPLWMIATVVFVVAWIGQFYGHRVEGKKPSFLKDVQFLLIGPAWLMGFVYQRLRIPY